MRVSGVARPDGTLNTAGRSSSQVYDLPDHLIVTSDNPKRERFKGKQHLLDKVLGALWLKRTIVRHADRIDIDLLHRFTGHDVTCLWAVGQTIRSRNKDSPGRITTEGYNERDNRRQDKEGLSRKPIVDLNSYPLMHSSLLFDMTVPFLQSLLAHQNFSIYRLLEITTQCTYEQLGNLETSGGRSGRGGGNGPRAE